MGDASKERAFFSGSPESSGWPIYGPCRRVAKATVLVRSRCGQMFSTLRQVLASLGNLSWPGARPAWAPGSGGRRWPEGPAADAPPDVRRSTLCPFQTRALTHLAIAGARSR